MIISLPESPCTEFWRRLEPRVSSSASVVGSMYDFFISVIRYFLVTATRVPSAWTAQMEQLDRFTLDGNVKPNRLEK